MERPKFNVSAKSKIPNTADISWNEPDINHTILHYKILYNIKDAGDQKQTANDNNEVGITVTRTVTII